MMYGKSGDSVHEVIEDVRFADGAKLHRFRNRAGVPYSAIYYGRMECVSNERSQEAAMIEHYRQTWMQDHIGHGYSCERCSQYPLCSGAA